MEKQFDVTRITNDVNGNPRYVVHFLSLLTEDENKSNIIPLSFKYQLAQIKAKISGGKRYHNKSYGGGIVFQSYNIQHQLSEVQSVFERSPVWVKADQCIVLTVMNDYDMYHNVLAFGKKYKEAKLPQENLFAEVMHICRDAAARYKQRVSQDAVFVATCEVLVQMDEAINS